MTPRGPAGMATAVESAPGQATHRVCLTAADRVGGELAALVRAA